jgi:hypothetical protein
MTNFRPSSLPYGGETLGHLLRVGNEGGKLNPVEPKGMSSSELKSLMVAWRYRLRNLRSGDHADVATLLATPHGPAIMAFAISGYLLDWAESDWVDETEIRMLASDLKSLWPSRAEEPKLFPHVIDKYNTYCTVFLEAFRARHSEHSKNLTDEIFEFDEQKMAMA